MIRVCIIEDSPADLEKFGSIVEHARGFTVIGKFTNCETALEEIAILKPNVILLDIELPGMSGVIGAGVLHFKFPAIDIIMLTHFESDEKLFESFSHGAVGYVLKTIKPPDLLAKIREVKNGGAPMSMSIARKLVESFRKQAPVEPLTVRENEVLAKILEGKNNMFIAKELNITKDTVKFHSKNILRKFQAGNRNKLIQKLSRVSPI